MTTQPDQDPTLQERLKHEHEYISDLGVTSWTLLDTIRDAAIRIDELERQLAEAQKDQADAKRYRYLRDTEVLPLRVYEALENNLGETLDLEIDYEIGMKAANAIQADDVAPKVKP